MGEKKKETAMQTEDEILCVRRFDTTIIQPPVDPKFRFLHDRNAL